MDLGVDVLAWCKECTLSERKWPPPLIERVLPPCSDHGSLKFCDMGVSSCTRPIGEEELQAIMLITDKESPWQTPVPSQLCKIVFP